MDPDIGSVALVDGKYEEICFKSNSLVWLASIEEFVSELTCIEVFAEELIYIEELTFKLTKPA